MNRITVPDPLPPADSAHDMTYVPLSNLPNPPPNPQNPQNPHNRSNLPATLPSAIPSALPASRPRIPAYTTAPAISPSSSSHSGNSGTSGHADAPFASTAEPPMSDAVPSSVDPMFTAPPHTPIPSSRIAMSPHASPQVPASVLPPAPPPIVPPSSAKHPQKRRSIGEWDFVKTIGAGSMGQVKLAENRYSGDQCAVKVIPRAHADHKRPDKPQKESDEAKNLRTVREAAIGKLLYHRHICQLYEVYPMTNHYYMLFEYVSGGQMLDYIISHGSLKEKQARKFARSISSALCYCHRNSIVHRDLKIENILISKSGDIKIIDFGLSNLFSRTHLLKTFCGSLYFAAPELLNARPYVGPEVDVWSFGIVLYVLVCGKVPFDDQSMPALHAKIKRGRVEYPNWLSSDCKDILSRMLVVDPTERASLSEIMHHPWMLKGYDAPPDPYVPFRRPLSLPLDPAVVEDMAGFEFGTPAEIGARLTAIIESADYQAAAANWYRINEPDSDYPFSDSSLSDVPSLSGQVPSLSKHFSFDFYRRRSSGPHNVNPIAQDFTQAQAQQHQLSLAHQLDARPGQGHTPPPDPTDAYHPLVSIYYLVHEKMEREKSEPNVNNGLGVTVGRQRAASALHRPTPYTASPVKQNLQRSASGASQPPHFDQVSALPDFRERLAEPLMERLDFSDQPQRPSRAAVAVSRSKTQGASEYESRRKAVPSGAPPPILTGNSRPAAQSTISSAYRPRHQSHVSEPPVIPPSPKTPSSNLATSLLRKFSTKRKPVASQVTASPSPDDLNRSTSVSESSYYRTGRRAVSAAVRAPPVPSGFRYPDGNDGSSGEMIPTTSPTRQRPLQHPGDVLNEKMNQMAIGSPSFAPTTPSNATHKLHPSARAKSLGHARSPRFSRDPPRVPSGDIADELFDDVALESGPGNSHTVGSMHDNSSSGSTQRLSGPSIEISDSMPSIQYPKQVFLKGFFSVQSTSTKSLPFIRSDIIRVLTHLGISFKEMKGGFMCIHKASIKPEDDFHDLGLPNQPAMVQAMAFSPPASPLAASANGNGHWRKLSFGSGILNSGSRRRSIVGGAGDSNNNILDSDMSSDSMSAAGHPGGSDMLGFTGSSHGVHTPVRFEIYIVKVPLLSLHGVQFKKLTGNSWQYKSLATKILSELRL